MGKFIKVKSSIIIPYGWKLSRDKCSRIAQFRDKSFANPIAVRHVTCRFRLCHWVFMNETEYQFLRENDNLQ